MDKIQNIYATSFLLVTYNIIVFLHFSDENIITLTKPILIHLIGSLGLILNYYIFELKRDAK